MSQGACWSKYKTPEWGSHRRICRAFLMHFILPGRKEWEWGCRSAGRSSRRTGAGCGPKRMEIAARRFDSLFSLKWRGIMNEPRNVVYVVDDDPSIRRSLERLFRSVGHECLSFGSAMEFLQSERRHAPACLVLDVRLPGLSGLDLQQEVARANVLIPLVFITGH